MLRNKSNTLCINAATLIKPMTLSLFHTLSYEPSKAGSINFFQSFACAIAAAVVGPPIFALLATKIESYSFVHMKDEIRVLIKKIKPIICQASFSWRVQ